MTDKALLISNDSDLLEAIVSALRREPFALLGARGAEDARLLLAREPIGAVIVDDVVSGGSSATELLVELARQHAHVPRMLLTARADINMLLALVNQAQVFRVLRKPWNADELALAVRAALRKLHLNSLTDRIVSLARRQVTLLEELDREALAAGESAPGSHVSQTQEMPSVLGAGGVVHDDPDPVSLLSPNELASLSRREKELLRAVIAGKKPRELARTFFISVHTARNHIKAIYRKLSVHSQGELIAKVLRAPGRTHFRSVG